MHLRASTVRSSHIAPVGQASEQSRQVPQWSLSSALSKTSAAEVTISPRKKNDPQSSLRTRLLRPRHPSPARMAQVFSVTGAELQKTPDTESGTSFPRIAATRVSFSFITL